MTVKFLSSGFREAISTSRIGDRFGGKASPRDDSQSLLTNEQRERVMEQIAMT